MLVDLTAISHKDAYKLLVSTVVPRPIAWVVTQSPEGVVNTAPFSFFNAFSGNPPTVCIGVGHRGPGRGKDTAVNIEATGEFVVNLVSEDTADAMNVTAIDFPPDVDEIEQAGLTVAASTRVRPPRIAESPVAYECTLLQIVELGPESALILGRVVAIHVRDEQVLDVAHGYIDTPALKLIARMHGRGWYARTTDLFDMPRLTLKEWEAGRRG